MDSFCLTHNSSVPKGWSYCTKGPECGGREVCRVADVGPIYIHGYHVGRTDHKLGRQSPYISGLSSVYLKGWDDGTGDREYASR